LFETRHLGSIAIATGRPVVFVADILTNGRQNPKKGFSLQQQDLQVCYKSIAIATQGRVTFEQTSGHSIQRRAFFAIFATSNLAKVAARQRCYSVELFLEQTSHCSIQKGFVCNKTSAIVNLKGTC